METERDTKDAILCKRAAMNRIHLHIYNENVGLTDIGVHRKFKMYGFLDLYWFLHLELLRFWLLFHCILYIFEQNGRVQLFVGFSLILVPKPPKVVHPGPS